MLLAIKDALIRNPQMQVLLMATFPAPKEFPVDWLDWSYFVGEDRSQQTDPPNVWVRHDLFLDLLGSTVSYYFKMRGKDYVKNVNGKRSTADLATKSVSHRGHVAVTGSKTSKRQKTERWVKATDTLGRTYYWEELTRQTSWFADGRQGDVPATTATTASKEELTDAEAASAASMFDVAAAEIFEEEELEAVAASEDTDDLVAAARIYSEAFPRRSLRNK